MSHIVKKEQGNNILTWCGRNISRGAAGAAAARSRRRRQGEAPRKKPGVPFFYLNQELGHPGYVEPHSSLGMTMQSLTGACDACVEALPKSYAQSWLVRVRKFLKNMKEIHIFDHFDEGSGVHMMCKKAWDSSSLFRNEIGYIEVADLKDHFDRPQLCETCTDHPRAQLQLLAVVDLGYM